MAQIGSFALLLALALSAYSFLAGLLALLRPGAGSERLGETARRAGIAAFAVVLLAAVVLVIAAFQDDFSIAYIFHHSNRDLPAPYKFATLWSGQEGSLLFWSLLLSAYGLVLRLRHKTDSRLFAHASVRFCAGCADHALSRRKVDSHYPPLDDGDLGTFDLRHLPRRALGLFRAGLGRLLGLGSRRKCLVFALAHGHGISPFGDDAGKARHAEGLEYVVDLWHIHAFYLWNVPHPQRCGQLGTCVCAIFYWHMVRGVSEHYFGGLQCVLRDESRASAQRTSTGVAGFPGIELSVQ